LPLWFQSHPLELNGILPTSTAFNCTKTSIKTVRYWPLLSHLEGQVVSFEECHFFGRKRCYFFRRAGSRLFWFACPYSKLRKSKKSWRFSGI
jgi:hypothetical protein